MERLTRREIEEFYPCRIKQCYAEEWMREIYGEYPLDTCGNCPFEKYINRLAELEDETEKMEDDCK